jgi:hypothetical protein
VVRGILSAHAVMDVAYIPCSVMDYEWWVVAKFCMGIAEYGIGVMN